ncbi:MAG: hypothetical protein LBE49_00985 [Deltaproteobacteria bacterium]|jgi:hypothetical protein|nr:hypothetical protein [Deltaproteobacteria bacterium]
MKKLATLAALLLALTLMAPGLASADDRKADPGQSGASQQHPLKKRQTANGVHKASNPGRMPAYGHGAASTATRKPAYGHGASTIARQKPAYGGQAAPKSDPKSSPKSSPKSQPDSEAMAAEFLRLRGANQ